MRVVVGTAVAAIAVAITGPAIAQSAPTDTDLKAAFCIGVLKDYSPADTSTAKTPDIARLEAETNAKVVAARQRIQAYLVPRARFIDQTSIYYAIAEGVRANDQALARFKECQSDPASLSALAAKDAKALAEAMSRCQGNASERIRSCFDPSFLPF